MSNGDRETYIGPGMSTPLNISRNRIIVEEEESNKESNKSNEHKNEIKNQMQIQAILEIQNDEEQPQSSDEEVTISRNQ